MDYEEKQTFQKKISARNTESAFLAIQDMDVFARETREKLDNLSFLVGELHIRLSNLETTINMLNTVKTIGLGPTVK